MKTGPGMQWVLRKSARPITVRKEKPRAVNTPVTLELASPVPKTLDDFQSPKPHASYPALPQHL